MSKYIHHQKVLQYGSILRNQSQGDCLRVLISRDDIMQYKDRKHMAC